MQPAYSQPNSRNIAFQQGLIAGLILAAIASTVLLINTFVNVTNTGTALLLTLLVFLLGLAAYFVAGILAAKKTGKVSTGTLAGLWTGGIYGVIGFVVSMVLFFSVNLPRLMANFNNLPSSTSTSADAFRAGATIGGVAFAIFGIAFAIGLGAGLGALGGLIGKSTSKVTPLPAYPHQPYPAQPYPPASAYPDQPYPNQPYPNQPYSDQPYPNQPYPNQPYEQ
ncbi:MAG TPA: hypothetical protein VKY19_21460 [Ktedonosporobacter sp.]|jgi:hypothetical protein|nr:hypothetical protein [Ktedonosporobacter sp.]